MKLVFILIIIVFSLDSISQEKWEITHYNHNDTPRKIICFDSLNSYIVCNYSDKIKLYKSTNQGESWDLIWETLGLIDQANKKYDPIIYQMRDMEITQNKTIYIASSGDSFLLKSIDDCKTFDTIDFKNDYRLDDITMYNDSIGIAKNGNSLYITKNAWNQYEELKINPAGIYFDPFFINDSIFITGCSVQDNIDVANGCLIYNIKSKIFEINTKDFNYEEYSMVSTIKDKSNQYYLVGQKRTGIGQRSRDIIYRSNDDCVSWNKIHDEEFEPAFGLQDIAFKNEKVGLAVGQFGKILYTYDGGDSWIYENKLHDTILEKEPPVMHVEYSGEVAILATYSGHFFRMVFDPNDISKVDEDYEDIRLRIEDKYLKFYSKNDLHNCKISVRDLNGKELIRTNFLESIPLNDLSNSVYLISVINNGKVIYNNKFILMY